MLTIPCFRNATSLEKAAALRHLRPARLDPDTVLMEAGDEDASLAVILEGKVVATTQGLATGTAGGGEVVGELALFTGRPRLASVRTLEDTKLLLLDRAGYEALRDAGNAVAFTMELDALAQVSHRLRRHLDILARIDDRPQPLPATVGTRAAGASREPEVEVADVLADSMPFAEFRTDVIEEIAAALRPVAVEPGTTLQQQGVEAEVLQVALTGSFLGWVRAGDGMVALPRAEPGRFCGAVSMLDRSPAPASWMATSQGAIGTLSHAGFQTLVERADPVGSAFRVVLIRSLAETFRWAYLRVVALGGPAGLLADTGGSGRLEHLAIGGAPER